MKLPRLFIATAVCLVSSGLVTLASADVFIDWAIVGNPGNAPDSTGFGSVSYEYRISKTEVTNDQYVEFLNAVAVTDPYGLYNPDMTSDPRSGILRFGSSGNYSYSTKANMGNKPVNNVDWYDAARFSNWMTNGQGLADTETGVYSLSGIETLDAITRDLSDPSQVFIPTEDEWYKAAYHQPVSQGGDFDDYWLYPTRSNIDPEFAVANSIGDISNPGANVMNYAGGADWNGQNGNVTTVGSAGILSDSFYGTSDQGGNVWEWNETLIISTQPPHLGPSRGLRGGSFRNFGWSLERNYALPGTDFHLIGFRVASPIPEPAGASLIALGCVGLARRRAI